MSRQPNDLLNHFSRQPFMNLNHDTKVILLTERIPPAFGGAGHRVYAFAKRLWKQNRLAALICYAPFARSLAEVRIHTALTIDDPLSDHAISFVHFRTAVHPTHLQHIFYSFLNSITTPIGVFLKLLMWRRHARIVHCFGIGPLTFWAVLASHMLGMISIV
jgi:hypothetical protein